MWFERFLRWIGWPKAVVLNGNAEKPLPAAPEGEIEPEELKAARRRSKSIEEKTLKCETELNMRLTEEGVQD